MAYDRLLVRGAAMLDVPAPHEPGVEALTALQRERFERGLALAGMEVRTDDL